MYVAITFLYIFFVSVERSTAQESSLQQVHVLFRHGARTPLVGATYPTDPYRDYVWPRGRGQLTTTGKQQMFQLGEYYRMRYAQFLNSSYIKSELQVESTDYDRTLISAQILLAGLYPIGGGHLEDANITFQPIPVHTRPMSMDRVLALREKCNKLTNLSREYFRSEYYINIVRENQNFFSDIGNYTGMGKNLNLTTVWKVVDALTIQKANNLTIPSWATDGVITRLERLQGLLYEGWYKNKQAIRFRGGVLLGKIAEGMEKKINGSSNSPKLFLYSGHDTTVTALMYALSINNDIPPPYASSVVLELHRTNNSYHYVKILYRNDTNAPPHEMAHPECGEECEWMSFLRATNEVRPEDWDKECENGQSPGCDDDCNKKHTPDKGITCPSLIVIFSIMGSIILLLILILMTFCCVVMRQKHKDNQTYTLNKCT